MPVSEFLTRALRFLVSMALLLPATVLADRPNIVLIISDDQAYRDFGFMGNTQVHTPHLDRLAKQSAFFPNGYVPSSVCSPSLATLLTGRYPHRTGAITPQEGRGLDRISVEEVTIGDTFRS